MKCIYLLLYSSPGDDWLAYEEGVQENWFNLDDESKMTDVLQERMTFWDSHSTKELYYEWVPSSDVVTTKPCLIEHVFPVVRFRMRT